MGEVVLFRPRRAAPVPPLLASGRDAGSICGVLSPSQRAELIAFAKTGAPPDHPHDCA